MFLWKRPSRQFVDALIAAQSKLDFSYPHVGASAAGVAPRGYVLDESRVELGIGAETFARACAGLRAWRHFQLGWVDICWPDTPLEPSQTVAVLAKAFGLWSLNACRIIETIDEQSAGTSSFGFVYGTLPEHAESGEERFVIEWEHADGNREGRVWYTILAFSRPNHFLVSLGNPFMRRLQEQFRQDSSAAMVRHCGGR